MTHDLPRVCKYNKMAFLLECLEDLDKKFQKQGGRLNMVLGDPVAVLNKIAKHFHIARLCFDQDPEALWLERDNAVKNFCINHKIKIVESIGKLINSDLTKSQKDHNLYHHHPYYLR